jgi:hypothetical protein
MLGFGFVTIEVWHTQLPVWAFILALIIGEFLNTPCGILDLMGVSLSFSIRVHDPGWCYSGHHEPRNQS